MPAERTQEPGAMPVVVVSGRIASGKSTLARALAERLGATRLEADRIRGTLLQACEDEAGGGAPDDGGRAGTEARWRRDLSIGFEQEIYADLLRRSAQALARGEALVVDACFPLRAQRLAMRTLAEQHGRPFLFVRCSVPDAVRRARLAQRDRAGGAPAWQAIDDRVAAYSEPPDEIAAQERIDVRCDGPLEPLVDAVVLRLRQTPVAARPAAPRDARALPRVVSFDCWGTLISEEDWHWAHTLRIVALREAAREAGVDVDFEGAKQAFEAAWHRHQALWQAGRASGAPEIADWGLAQLGLERAGAARADLSSRFESARTHLVRRFEEASHTSHVVALEGAQALLSALGRAGVPCVLVCDTGLTPGRVVRRLLDGLGLLEHLAVQSFSDEVGFPKPDRRPFLAAIEPLGASPSDVLHVGDLRRTDVAGARALGMRSVRIRARHDDASDLPDADHVVDSHAGLAALLGLDLGATPC